jgi:hypothetical protein
MEYTDGELELYKEYLNFIKRIIIDKLKEKDFRAFLEGIDFISIKKELKNGNWIFHYRASDGDSLMMEEAISGKYSGISFQKFLELKKRDDRDKKLKELGL